MITKDAMKRRRRVGAARTEHRRKYVARQAAEQAEDDVLRAQLADLDASVREERATAERPEQPIDRELAARIDAAVTRADATFAAFETKLDERLRRASAMLRDSATVMAQFFDNAERAAARQQIAADTATQHVLDRLRAGQLSRKQLGAPARAIAGQLGELETAIRDARAAHDTDAGEHGRTDLAEAARDRMEYWRRNTRAQDAALRELLALQDRLAELGRLVLEAAGS